ncbi:retrovirus-related Pol polyprotein from type-1 retrotransposable element R1 [Caerostris darwini]|uniref:Retrovirus-related Pol polyprotein from type-1 retrotransposable element R1 n=1 Tax=Caerostris darwini TaxID=1538125 RepID=A0AAV4QM85_9ARAC|nr:retrovirus-related Pol polyprotein from type-1 retrotransposable element R1 [Caerostris darwini]
MGIPQGSCLGPALWNIFINDLLQIDFGNSVSIQAFADDLIIMMKERATYLFKETSIGPLNIVNKWIQDHRLEINYDKSCYIIASSKKFSHIPSLRINNHKITHSVNLKYLGVLIDSKLTWNAHLNYVKDKINKV